MKCLVKDTNYTRFYNIVGEVVTGELTINDTCFDIIVLDKKHRLFKHEYKLIPEELENESIETIKFWAAL